MILLAHQQGHKVNATVTTTVTMTRMRWLRTGILATAFVLTGCQPVTAATVPAPAPELVAAWGVVLLLGITLAEYVVRVGQAQYRQRHHLRGEGVHEHKWYDRPFLTDGDVDVYACKVPGCRAHKREVHKGPR